MHGTMTHSFSIAAFNRATPAQATAMMDRIVERSPWLARRAAQARPFADSRDLAAWIDTQVRSLPTADAVQLLCAHPELAPPDPSAMTPASQTEQGRLDLLAPAPDIAAMLADLNRRYVRRHGFPFVVALHEHDDIAGVIDQLGRRIEADRDEERARALGQVVSVMTARLNRLTADAPAAGIAARRKPARPGSEGVAS